MTTRRLTRSRTDHYIAGVCGGLGEYFDVDSAFIRLIFVLAAFAGGGGVLAYGVLWLTVPEAPFTSSINQEVPMDKETKQTKSSKNTDSDYSGRRQRGGMMGGMILVLLGLLFLADNYLPGFDFGHLWPLILVVIGFSLLLRGNQR